MSRLVSAALTPPTAVRSDNDIAPESIRETRNASGGSRVNPEAGLLKTKTSVGSDRRSATSSSDSVRACSNRMESSLISNAMPSLSLEFGLNVQCPLRQPIRALIIVMHRSRVRSSTASRGISRSLTTASASCRSFGHSRSFDEQRKNQSHWHRR